MRAAVKKKVSKSNKEIVGPHSDYYMNNINEADKSA